LSIETTPGVQAQAKEFVVVLDDIRQRGEAAVVVEAARLVRPYLSGAR
jgi:hypothetical protein